jgi:hypothetical protein
MLLDIVGSFLFSVSTDMDSDYIKNVGYNSPVRTVAMFLVLTCK